MDHHDDAMRFTAYRANVGPFIQDIVSAAVIDDADYVPGTQRIDFYEQLFQSAGGFLIYDYKRSTKPANAGPYEEALYQRVASPIPGLLVLIGGLGSGKSTAVRHLFATLEARREELGILHPCTCNPCVRRPIIVDCLDLDRTFSTNECEAEVMMRIRREAYRQIIDEWHLQNGDDPAKLRNEDRKVLRRLVIANDIYHWADGEALEFPAQLHTPALTLPDDLLSYTPKDWNVPVLTRDYLAAANELDAPIQDAISNVGLGKRFTALILGFWLRSCNPRSPNSLIVVDNLDQQPTDNIEQIVNHLHDLDVRHRGLRLLLPMRPSSIVPHGFTKNTNYMYHYGPNCFDLIYKRLHKYVLSRPRSELVAKLGHGRPFAVTPSPEEITCFLVVTYIYSLICINGLRPGLGDDADDIRPRVHADHDFLHRINFAGAAVQQLADTLAAVVGTCGRYATDQLRRYFDHVYGRHSFLRQIEAAGLAKGASPRLGVPFGQIVSSVLGAHDADSGLTGLANLYSPTRVRPNTKHPTLAKLRVLAFLAVRARVRVSDVIAALAQYGIPWEVSIDALNYLHAKNRLLLWFSRNTDLPTDSPDIEQYVVISEHGQAYLKDLVGDFEYVWFCAQQILAIATSDNVRTFRTRLSDYSQLLADLSMIEWKQMTFRRCSSATVWTVSSSDVDGEEMLSLFILYSSLERALRSAAVAVRRKDSQYVEDVVGVIEALVNLILTRQDDYEVYYGDDGYVNTYALKIDKSRREVERLRGDLAFISINTKLDELVRTWSHPAGGLEPMQVGDGRRAREVAVAPGVRSDRAWVEFVNGIASSALRPEERHACASLGAALMPLLARRETLSRTLATRFPVFSLVDHELALLVEETKVALDAAERLAAYARPLLDWLERELAGTADLREVLNANAFRIPDLTSMQEMDGLKTRANNISTAYVALAQRLGATTTQHLAVRWSV